MATAVVPLIAVILGALTYALSANAKTQELGRLTFACGMLVVLWLASQHTWSI